MKNLIRLAFLLLSLTFSVLAFGSSFVDNDELFLKNIDESFSLRAQGIEYYKANVSKFSKSGVLTHNDLMNIYGFSAQYLSHRAKLFKEINAIEEKIHLLDRVVIKTSVKTGFKKVMGVRTHYINPLEEAGQRKLREFNKATAYGLMLFDNFLALVAPYYSHEKVRYLLNRDFPGKDRQFDEIVSSYYNIPQRKLLLKGIKIFEKGLAAISKYKVKQDEFDSYLVNLIKSSPSISHLKDVGSVETGTFSQMANRISGELRFGIRAGSFQTSKLFGNTMGIFQSRSGLLKNMPEAQKKSVARRLKPLDVLLEKTPFRLTDTFIPGYYGHVAIWVGTEEELRELGLWDHPAIKPHQKAIRSGHHIVEALRPGVQINTLDHFLDIDDMVALRPNSLSDSETKEYLVRAFQQIGKAYDFNFDVETDNLIVCSEIAYVVFHNVSWPTDRTLGRATISPDHVAWEGVEGGPFTPVVLFKNGKEVKDNIPQVFRENISGPERLK